MRSSRLCRALAVLLPAVLLLASCQTYPGTQAAQDATYQEMSAAELEAAAKRLQGKYVQPVIQAEANKRHTASMAAIKQDMVAVANDQLSVEEALEGADETRAADQEYMAVFAHEQTADIQTIIIGSHVLRRGAQLRKVEIEKFTGTKLAPSPLESAYK